MLRYFAIFLACIDSSIPEWLDETVNASISGENFDAIEVINGESIPPDKNEPNGTSLIV